MATYPTLAATLAALNSTKNDPQGNESANLLDDAIRQTRVWLYDFLSIYIDPTTNKIKASGFAIGDDGSFPPGSIRGTNPVDGSQREIAQGTVNTADLRDGAVTSVKIAASGVGTTNIAAGAVTGEKLANASVTPDKMSAQVIGTSAIENLAVTSAKLATDAVISDKIADSSVRTQHIMNGQVTGVKLVQANKGYMMVGGNGTGENEYKSVLISGAITVDSDGITSFAEVLDADEIGYTLIAETAGTGVDGGNPAAVDSWEKRGTGPANPWAVVKESRKLVEPLNGKIYFLEDGVYYVYASAPGNNCAAHQARVLVKPNTKKGEVLIYDGTSEFSNAAVTTRSHVWTLVTVVGANPQEQVEQPYLEVEHAVGGRNTGVATYTWGRSSGLTVGQSEMYATVLVIKFT